MTSQRCGWLRNGNRPGDVRSAPRCGARTRRGTACECPAIRGKARCRLHGGLSTGPRTAEGYRRLVASRLKHGRYSTIDREARQLLAGARADAAKSAATTRDSFMRRVYISIAARPFTADELEQVRQAVISDRVATKG